MVTRENEFGQPIGEVVAWSRARTPEPRVFEGRWIRLEPLTIEHAPALLAELGPHPDLWTYQAEEVPTSLDEAAASVAGGADRIGFAIIDRATGAFRGRVSLLRIQPTIGTIEVGGIIYTPALQRTRAATEVQYLLLRHAFDDLGYRRYEWKCDSLNLPSRTAARRLGFTEEGTWRNALVTKGRNRDTTWFSITDAEWPAVRAALAAWLADDNFDAVGVQLRSLAELRAALDRPRE